MSKLIVLVGIPGSGKSTYGKELLQKHNNAVYLSSDMVRKELYGDSAIVGDKNKVFRILHQRKKVALSEGKTIIFDATNLTRKSRRNVFSDANNSVVKEIHIVWAPIDVCLRRDEKRQRTVGYHDIMRLASGFQAPWYDEGVHTIKLIVNYEHSYHEYVTKCINQMQIPHDNPHHQHDIFNHCIAAYQHGVKMDYLESVLDAAMFHDIGKPITKTYKRDEESGKIIAHYYQHDNIGGWMSYGLFTDAAKAIEVAWLIGNHMQPYFQSHYYKDMTHQWKLLLEQLHDCDEMAH